MKQALIIALITLTVMLLPQAALAVQVKNMDKEPRVVVVTSLGHSTTHVLEYGQRVNNLGPGITLQIPGKKAVRTKPDEKYIIYKNTVIIQWRPRNRH